jgi:hypothetical protein
MELEAIDSSLISHRGYAPATNKMQLRFVHKKFKFGPLYEYQNITPAMWEDGVTWRNDNDKSESFGDLSFGQWFIRLIKDNPKFPFRKIEDAHGDLDKPDTLGQLKASVDATGDTRDFTSQGQVLPAIEAEPLPEDRDKLIEKAIALQDKVRAIVINSPEAYSAAAVTGTAVAAMQVALKKAFYEGEDGITARFNRHRELTTIYNSYNDPLERDKARLRDGMVNYKREQDRIAAQAADAERARLQKIADEEARQKAEELKKADIQAAKDAGETKLAKQIEKAPALPVAPAFVPPVHVPSAAAPQKGSAHVPQWTFEWTNARGERVEHPDLSLIPAQYITVDEKAIGAAVRATKNRTAIPGVRAYDAGNVRFSSKK